VVFVFGFPLPSRKRCSWRALRTESAGLMEDSERNPSPTETWSERGGQHSRNCLPKVARFGHGMVCLVHDSVTLCRDKMRFFRCFPYSDRIYCHRGTATRFFAFSRRFALSFLPKVAVFGREFGLLFWPYLLKTLSSQAFLWSAALWDAGTSLFETPTA
jgi:hypothetical protein